MVIRRSTRGAVSRLLHAKNDKEAITAWKSDLNRILQVFNVRSVVSAWSSLIVPLQTELVMNTHVTVSDIRRDLPKIQVVGCDQVHSVSASRILIARSGGGYLQLLT